MFTHFLPYFATNMILQLLNGDLLYPPEKVSSIDDAKIWLATTDLFPNSPHHIVVTRINAPDDDDEKYLVMYAQPSIHLPDPFTFPESQYNFSNSTWMSNCINESILTYLTADERYLPTFLTYPGIWRNSHPLVVARVMELLPPLHSHKLRPNCIDLIWSNIWANSNSEVVDVLITRYYRDTMCFALRTMIENTNPRMVDWCMQHLFEEPDDMPLHLMHTRVTNLMPNATTPETVCELWEKWKKIPQATFRQLPFNRLSPEYLTLFQRDFHESQLYKFVKYDELTDEDLALECAKALRKSGPNIMWSTAKCPCEKLISYLLDEVYKDEIDSLRNVDHLTRNPTDRAVDLVLARMTLTSDYNTDRVFYLLRHNNNPRAVQFCKEKLANDGRDLFDIVNQLGEKHYGNGYVGLEHLTPALASWICTQPSFVDRVCGIGAIGAVGAIGDSGLRGLRKKWIWNTIIALSRSNECHVYFVEK